MKFLDDVVLLVRSGAGGAGSMSFRREKFVEFGGPDGGNGGKGGCVWVEGAGNLNTLIDYRFRPVFKAATGGHGMGRNRTGAAGADLTLKVPLGTEVIDHETGRVLADITQEGQRFHLLRGGRGGRGNASYKTSTNQAPRQFTPGEPLQEMQVRFRLKLLADVGLLGLPNAGKSTFVRAVSRAKPKIADYPFTTLHPALGLVRTGNTEFLMADLPGLIEGAAAGLGLGHDFLMHLSRCRAVLHLVDAHQDDPVAAYRTIRKELKAYDKEFGTSLMALPEVVGLTKTDLLEPADATKIASAFTKKTKIKPLLIAAAAQVGTDVAVKMLAGLLASDSTR